MSSSYYGRIKTRDEILKELKDSVENNLYLINNVLNHKINISDLITEIHGVKICNLNESFFNEEGLSGKQGIKDLIIESIHEEKDFNNFMAIIKNISIVENQEKILKDKFLHYHKIIKSYDIQSSLLKKKYNMFIDKINTIFQNDKIIFSSKLRIIDEDFDQLIEFFEQNKNDDKINKIISEIYDINIDYSKPTIINQLINLVEERYINQSIEMVLNKYGYKENILINFNSMDGNCYINNSSLNDIFVAKNEDKLIIESVYDNTIYMKTSSQQLIENFKLSCEQNKRIIDELEEYGLTFEMLYCEEPDLKKVSIINHKKNNNRKSLKNKKEMFLDGKI